MTTVTRLVADVGGTNTRLALFDPGADELRAVRTYENRDHARFEDIIACWLQSLDEPPPTTCCIAVAAPPAGDRVTMVNINWSFSCRDMARRFGFTRLGWINDFQAIAYALPHLGSTDRQLLHAGRKDAQGVLATMGPGTGLGGATLEIVAGIPLARACEPGQMGLAAATALELEIVRLLLPDQGEIHAELLVSGPGLQRLYLSLAQIRGETVDQLAAAEISSRALQGQDELCVQTLNTFCALLGSACGDFVLANGAYGGLYLAGGIIPRLIPFLRASGFAERFREKGSMSDHLAGVPLYAITTAQPGLIGAAHAPL
jgi:glucokinase